MPIPSRVPRAIWHPIAGWPTGAFSGGPHKVVWHTTQGYNIPWSTYRNGGGIPHLTIPHDGRTRQHYGLDVYSRALANQWGGVQTNLDGAWQIEIVGFAGKHFTAEQEREILRLHRFFIDECGIEPTYPAGRPTGHADPRDPKLWDTSGGFWGHSQVPENNHWDPAFRDRLWSSIEAELQMREYGEWNKEFNRAEAGTYNSVVEFVQWFLKANGFGGLVPDGLKGPFTVRAFQQWAVANGHNDTELMSHLEWQTMQAAMFAPRPEPTDCSAIEVELQSTEVQLQQAQAKIAAARTALS